MKFQNNEQSIILICASIILHIGASSDSEILKSLKIEYSVADKNDYSFFPVIGGDLTIPCDTSDGHQKIPLWYKVIEIEYIFSKGKLFPMLHFCNILNNAYLFSGKNES